MYLDCIQLCAHINYNKIFLQINVRVNGGKEEGDERRKQEIGSRGN